MKTCIPLAILAVAFGFTSCKKKQPETVPVPKAEPPAQAAPAVSTSPVLSQNPLTAPGNYLKTTVGRVKEAKDAKALFEKTAGDRLKNPDLNEP